MSPPSWRETATVEGVSASDSPCLRAFTYLLVLFVGIVVVVVIY
jgi:hypothetical protein